MGRACGERGRLRLSRKLGGGPVAIRAGGHGGPRVCPNLVDPDRRERALPPLGPSPGRFAASHRRALVDGPEGDERCWGTANMTAAPDRSSPLPRHRVLALIAVFKLVKAALMLVVVAGAFELVRPAVRARAQEWLGAISFTGEPQFVRDLVAWVSGIGATRIRELGLVALGFALLYIAEGVGLWLEQRWAEYLTVVATASLIPFELFALAAGVTGPKLFTFVVNVLVCAYLVWLLRGRHEDRRQPIR